MGKPVQVKAGTVGPLAIFLDSSAVRYGLTAHLDKLKGKKG